MSAQLNKYYTPEIEEFHVGFEYEMRDLDGSKTTLTGNPNKDIPVYKNYFEKKITSFEDFIIVMIRLEADKIRVKYLDKKDIESLGFEFVEEDGDLVFKSIKTYRGVGTGDDSKIWILYYPKNQWTLIYKKSNRGEEDNLFYGIIKNKSELKKLLKQLSIS